MTEEDWMSEVDEKILAVLEDGPRTKGALIDEIGVHRNTMYQHLKNLRVAGKIEFLHEPTSLYQLKNSE